MSDKLNINKSGCNPTSSNCIVWQGPNIECLGLCHGDSITEVVYELATKFCNLLSQFDVTEYDLQCLATQECPPKTFKDMIALLIEAICEVQNRSCPECEDGLPGNYVQTAYEPSGANCQYGGVAITTYDGLTNLPIPGEVRYICNGAPGQDGQDGLGLVGEKGKKGDTGSNGDTIVMTEEPAGANCDCGGIKVQTLSGIDSSVLDTEYICNGCDTNSEYGLETFNSAIIIGDDWQPLSGNIPQTSTSIKGFAQAQIITKYTHIYSNEVSEIAPTGVGTYVLNIDVPSCSFGTFDNVQGKFTVSQAGTYMITASVQLKPDNSTSVPWQNAGVGTFGVGIITGNTTDVFTGNYTPTVENLQKQISASTSVVSNLGTNSTIRISVINFSDRNYDGRLYVNPDIIRFSITKIK